MTRVVALAALVALTACAEPERTGPERTGTQTSAVTPGPPTCQVSGTTVGGSLVITDPVVLARFGFARTMDRIAATAQVGTADTALALWQGWMRTFGASPAPGDCDDVDVHGYGLTCPRVAEAKLATIDPFPNAAAVRFEPVALVNRFDLTTGVDCGLYRIIYAMHSTSSAIGGRGFIAFDGSLPSSTPARGWDACTPVWRMWQSLSTDPDPAHRADVLERFFYLGTAVPGFGAVVRAANYGLANGANAEHRAGAITTNFFVDQVEWNLRQYQLRRTCGATPGSCRVRFELTPLPSTPDDSLFAGTMPMTAAARKALARAVRATQQFQLEAIILPATEAWNQLESVASSVRYDLVASPYLRRYLGRDLNHNGTSFTLDEVLRRATTQTCSGCHQVSGGVDLGGGMTWPASLGAVHIDEQGQLSPLLTDHLLPVRRDRLEAFINQTCATP